MTSSLTLIALYGLLLATVLLTPYASLCLGARLERHWSPVWTGSEMIIWGGIIETQQGSRYCAASPNAIFADGFASGDTSAWSLVVP